jgi:hypothetical protein
MLLRNVTAPLLVAAMILPTLFLIETDETAEAATVQARMIGRSVVVTLAAVADILLPTDLMTVTAPDAVADLVNETPLMNETAPEQVAATVLPIDRTPSQRWLRLAMRSCRLTL